MDHEDRNANIWDGVYAVNESNVLIRQQSYKAMCEQLLKQSVHMEPFGVDRILAHVSADILREHIRDKKIVFFGTGSTSDRIFKNFGYKVDYVVDNDTSKWGQIFNGLEVRQPATLLQEDKDSLAIIVASQFFNEISSQLWELGFENCKHYWNGHKILDLREPYTNQFFYEKYMDKSSTVAQTSALKVSVILSGYHIRHLDRRLFSVIHQTIPVHELIFVHEDASCEWDSFIQALLQGKHIPYKIILANSSDNKARRRRKGIQAARGDIIWLADSMDVCRLDFLEEVLKPFAEMDVTISYCQSHLIDIDLNVMVESRKLFTDEISKTKWLTDYCVTGQDEIEQGLGIKNTIPFPGAALLRKSALDSIDEMMDEYELLDDWALYLTALRNGKIAFCAKSLNYHWADTFAIPDSTQSTGYFQELLRIKQFILDHYFISAHGKEAFLSCFSMTETKKIPHEVLEQIDSLRRWLTAQISNNRFLAKRERILIVVPDLEVGGGQGFAIRLANFLSSFQEVYLYNARPYLVHEQVKKTISSSVYQLPSTGKASEIALYIKKYSINIVNSHVWAADKITYPAISEMPYITWVLSMHGCYEALAKYGSYDPSGKDKEHYSDFHTLFKPIIERADAIVYPADKNLESIVSHYPQALSKMHKIYYGFAPQLVPSKHREAITQNPDDFVFGIVSRATPEKGWEESIQAIIRLNHELRSKHHLVLVGKSSFSARLREEYGEHKYIHFVEEFTQPSEWLSWLQIFDVALLPSYFPGESLPNSIIEYLTFGKPVITTDIGEIKNMVTDSATAKAAGIVLSLNRDHKVKVEDIATAMRLMISDKAKLAEYRNNTKLMVNKFSMPTCANGYFSLFSNVAAKKM